MSTWNEQFNECHSKRNVVNQEIRILRNLLSQKLVEQQDLTNRIQEIYKEMHKPNFDKITKREIVKCFSSTVKLADVEIQVKVCGMWHTIKRVSELEKEVELVIRLKVYLGDPLDGEIVIIINNDKSFKLVEDVKEKENDQSSI